MRYVRIYSDPDGGSHLEELDFELLRVDYAPPAPAIDVSVALEARRAVFFSMPAGWFGDWHPTPHRQLYCNLGGRLEVCVSDGARRTLEAGDVVLLEDRAGAGHTTRVLGDLPSSGVFIHLADEADSA